MLLESLSQWMIPAMIFGIVAAGVIRKQNVYEDFMKGAKDGILMVWKILPTMIALMMGIQVLRASGFLDFIGNLAGPLAKMLHFPAPLIPLAILKIFSGSGATGLLLDLYQTYGTDSLVGRIGSVMLSCTETIFYTLSLYFVTIGIKKSRYTLAGCFFATLTGIISSVIFASL